MRPSYARVYGQACCCSPDSRLVVDGALAAILCMRLAYASRDIPGSRRARPRWHVPAQTASLSHGNQIFENSITIRLPKCATGNRILTMLVLSLLLVRAPEGFAPLTRTICHKTSKILDWYFFGLKKSTERSDSKRNLHMAKRRSGSHSVDIKAAKFPEWKWCSTKTIRQ
jgi:hypothetical protein